MALIREFLSAGGDSTTGSPSVTTSSATLSTDLLLLIHHNDYGVLSDMGSPGVGWFLETDAQGAHGAITVWSKIATGGAQTVSVSQTGNGRFIGLYVLENASLYGTALSATGPYLNPINAPSRNVPTGCTVINFWGATSFGATTNTTTVPPIYVVDGDTYFDSGSSAEALFAHKFFATSVSTGPVPATMSYGTGNNFVSASIVVQPGGLPNIHAAANLSLSASAAVVPGLVVDAPLGLDASASIVPFIDVEAHLDLSASGDVPAPPVDTKLDTSKLKTLSLAEQRTPQYRLSIAHTRSGKIMADVPIAGTPTWTATLNATGTLSNVIIPMYPQLDPDIIDQLTTDYRWTLVLSYGNKILQAGMIFGAVMDDSQSPPTLTVNTVTLWQFLTDRRLMTYPGTQITDPASNVSFSATATDPANQNLSWAGVARRIVEIATALDPQMALPIKLPVPTSGTATIAYAGSDLATPGQRLTDIIGLDTPPEITFDPVWVDSNHTFFRWDALITDGRLGQLGFPHVWDYQKACQSLVLTRDASKMTFYVFSKGQDNRGTTGGTLSWAFTDNPPTYSTADTTYPWPFLWTADTTHSSETNPAVLKKYANALVATNQRPIYTAAATIRVDGKTVNGDLTGSPSLDQIRVGDTAYVEVVGHPFLADGKYGFRILVIGNGPDPWSAVLTMQMLGVPQ